MKQAHQLSSAVISSRLTAMSTYIFKFIVEKMNDGVDKSSVEGFWK